MTVESYGFNKSYLPENALGTPARITAVHKERYEIVSDFGESHAKIKTAAYYIGDEPFPTVGDFVLIDYNPIGDSMITKTLKRKTFFSRRDPDPQKGEQAVSANFDYVFIMQSLNADFNERRLERYLALSRKSGAEIVVILTKADLVEDASEYYMKVARLAPDVSCHAVSAKTGEGLKRLFSYLSPGKTTVFLGSSGVGKSSLVNALFGREVMNTNDIREDDDKGRHTTTYRKLLMLPNGAMIIDTPGMRELGMWALENELDIVFSDVEALLGKCRFSNCSHTSEPGCAILSALEDGSLSPDRWRNYQAMDAESRSTETKAQLLEKKHQKMKDISKFSKAMKKQGKIRY
ncbi:MAG: ribosome small subunit-dependent GTPase A [Clostridia bacterium]|nr:ribosome small subunit-dependent GTPase A [Clostridia bacterium]